MKQANCAQDIDLREMVKLNIKFATWLCCFYPRFENASLKKGLYLIYFTVFTVFLFILSFLSQLIDLANALGNIESMTQVLFICLTNLVQCFKLYSFLYYRTRMWKLIDSMNKNIFKPKNATQYDILQREIRKSKLITKTYFLACTLTCMIWGISPLLDNDVVRLPLSGWYPFPVDRSPNFEFVYIYQILAAWLCGIGDISMDTFMSSTVMFVSSQLSILNNALENMNKKYHKNVRYNINDDLIQNVVHYKNIIRFGNEAITLFSAGITAQIVVGVIVLCMSMFRLSVTTVGSFQFFAMGIYQMCMFIEIYLSCFFGNEVIMKSDKLTQSAYMCEWLEAPKEFKQNLIIFMTRTQFPLELGASGYFPLSIRTFKAIAKTSWSYFAVLNQIHEQKLQ